MMKFLFKSILLFGLLFPVQMMAQQFKFSKYFDIEDSTQIHVIETYRGDAFKGRVLTMDDDNLHFLTIGLLALDFKLNEVKSVLVEGRGELKNRSDKFKYENAPQLTVIVSSTAFMLPRGMRVYQNVDLFWNSFDIGLGKGFTVGVASLLPIMYNVKGRYSYKIGEDFHIGVDVNLINIITDWDEFYSYAFTNGIITIGKPYFFINVSVGNFKSIFDSNQSEQFNESVVGFALGGTIKRFIFKGEALAYRAIQSRNEDEIAFTPSFCIGWKSKNSRNRYDVGIMTMPVGETIFPYFSFQRYY